MSTKKPLNILFSLLVVLSLVLAACQSAAAPTTATQTNVPATEAPTKIVPSATNTIVPTPTELPDPGTSEIDKLPVDRSVNKNKFMALGPVETYGLTFDENSHDPELNPINTEAFRALVLVKNNGKFDHVLLDERMTLNWDSGTSIRYMSWFWNPDEVTIDADLLIQQVQYLIAKATEQYPAEMLNAAPSGFGYYTVMTDVKSPMPPVDPALPFSVVTDHKAHKAPSNTYMPAVDYTNLTSGQTVVVEQGSIVIDTHFCTEGGVTNKKWTIIIATANYTAQCPTAKRESFTLYYGDEDTINASITPEQKRALYKWAAGQINVHSKDIGHNNVEVFWDFTTFVYGDILPFADFASLHTSIPSPTPTFTMTVTSTPRTPSTLTPTVTATPTKLPSSTPGPTNTPQATPTN